MTDHLSKERRSWNMSRIRSENTKPEKLVRSLLHRAGYRFRLHDKKLPGKPDIVLAKYRTVIFVYGCFWHRHPGCRQAMTPSSNQAYWLPKFQRTVERDRQTREALVSIGWKVIEVWECEVEQNPASVLRIINDFLRERRPPLETASELQAAEPQASYGQSK